MHRNFPHNFQKCLTVKVTEKRRTGYVPLCDVEVKPKTDKNFWPVREYVVWFANR